MNTKLLISLALVAITTLSCTKKETVQQATPAKADTTDLKIAVMPTADCLPFYVAEDKQIFRSLGLNVKLVSYKSLLKCSEVFAKGRVDGTFTALPEAIYLKAQGTGHRIVMRTEGDVSIIANKAKRIKKLSSMRERLIGVTRHATSEYLTDEIGEITKIPSFEILRPQINDILIRNKMLLNNQLDAAAVAQPYSELLQQEGHMKVFSTQNSGIKFGCIVIADTVLKNKKEKVRLLLKGYEQAAQQLAANRNAADSVLIKFYAIPADRLDSVKMLKYPKPQRINSKDYDKAVKWCMGRKYIDKRIEENDIVTTEFLSK